MNVMELVRQNREYTVALRREFHQYPEVSWKEFRTTQRIREELDKLNRRYQSDTMEFIVVYGRRRVGKTALINEFIKDKPVIYFSAINANAKDNLDSIKESFKDNIIDNLRRR